MEKGAAPLFHSANRPMAISSGGDRGAGGLTQLSQGGQISGNQGHFLGATPPFQLAFAADGLRMGGAFFHVGHAVGGMRRRVAGTVLGEVASKSFFHAAGVANIE